MTQLAAANFVRVCSLDELWEGEMAVFNANGQDVLLVHSQGGAVAAFDPVCPHQNYPLVEGELDGRTLTCAAHLWQFDAATGAGINPEDCKLRAYAVKIDRDQVFVEV